jgi:hypothetical protein
MKNLFVLTTMCIITMLFTNKAMSQVGASGTTGACTWTVTGTPPDNYTLTISGSGAMGNYNSETYIPWGFYRNGIKTLDLQQGVTYIGSYAFRNCSSLTSVTIPNSVTSIGSYAFESCSSLTELYVKAQTPPALSSSTFYNVPGTGTVHVPCGKVSAYLSASGWGGFSNYIDDISLLNLSVQSNDATMGTATVIQGDRIEFYNMLGHPQSSIVNAPLSIIDVSHLANGVYLLRIVSDNRVICAEKVVIAR